MTFAWKLYGFCIQTLWLLHRNPISFEAKLYELRENNKSDKDKENVRKT